MNTDKILSNHNFAKKQGLYDPSFEKDSCGVGFVCDIKGRASHKIVEDSLNVLKRLAHRGATGADPKTGDGAGILLKIPHKFFTKVCENSNIKLPNAEYYAVGVVFLPVDNKQRQFCKDIFKKVVAECGQEILGWRDVPVNDSCIGDCAKKTKPCIEQIFIGRSENVKSQIEFERLLYVVRKQVENIVRSSDLSQKTTFYINSLSSRTISYKGLLMSEQVDSFFLDLKDVDVESPIGLVHSRYSTNTFPSWDLAQPFRFLAHNGEINTLRGNVNWMRARESLIRSDLFNDIQKIRPFVVPGGSDSAAIDNMFELLLLSGRSMAHSIMMLIPSAWHQDKNMNEDLRAFYKYHSCLVEPWDGPSAIAFTDGTSIGAVLDRNGLRPARYIVTRDDVVIMASEVGVLDIEPSNIRKSARLEPGKMLYIDTSLGKILDDEAIKRQVSRQCDYERWVEKNLVDLDSIESLNPPQDSLSASLSSLMKVFGYTREDIKDIIKPMILESMEPTGSMGSDIPHSVLSNKPHLLYTYFKQLFAQVTNPPIDSIREEIVMTLESVIGPAKNILSSTAEHARRLVVRNPIMTNGDINKIKTMQGNGFRTKVVSTLFDCSRENGFEEKLELLPKQVESAIKEGYSFVILSDRGVCSNLSALPALLAVSAVHQYLVKNSLRTQIGIILETAEPREVHHFAVLFGYGVDCINPYMAYEVIRYLIDDEKLSIDYEKAEYNYIKVINKGILKILSKMGISTLQSYRGAQIFEALGLSEEFVDKYFTGTVSRIGGIGVDVIARETLSRHKEAFSKENFDNLSLSSGGIYKWRKDGEFHLWNPESIPALQIAVRENNYSKFKEFANLIDDQSKNPTTLRGLLKFKKSRPVDISKVEPVQEIFKRFATGAMSFGSISGMAHRTIAIAMNKIGGKSNTGEGGEDPARFTPLASGESARSAIKQVASGRFGVTTNYLVNADEIQIKISQGAKPGEGGQLPGHKVSVTIAKTRYTTPGVTLISPPPHHDIYSIEDLAQLIFDLKNVNPKARISVKLVSEVGVGTVAAGVAKAHADMILISGGDGGTGAAPLSSIRYAGLCWELGLSETHQTLVLNDLRSRVRLQTDGQMRTGRDVAIAAILGAEEFGFCTSALIVLGCVMLRHCNLNNCSVGIATQDEILEKRFSGLVDYLVNYFTFVAEHLREIMAELGVCKVDQLIGNTELLELNDSIVPDKARGLDYSKILYKPVVSDTVGRYCTTQQKHAIENVLDLKLIENALPALDKRTRVDSEFKINNTNRTTGGMLSGQVCQKYGEDALGEDTINYKFRGVAGQSFGAFLAKGITFSLEGLANDYVGKGISGGKIIIYPDRTSSYNPIENVIIGNTTFYGAISGEAYIAGTAGERFCIRNSGLYAVVEGVGDHGCEYMTGGVVVVLGNTGRNFAAGMSGGTAYVYDEKKCFDKKCNMEMVELDGLDDNDKKIIHNLLRSHFKYTKSSIAKDILDNSDDKLKYFVKVIPTEYKNILKMKESQSKKNSKEMSDG